MPLTLKKENAAWLAAMIDGEGCIGINRNKKQNRPNYMFLGFVKICNTNKNLISECARITQKGSVQIKTKNRNRPLYELYIATKEASDVLTSIYPYLIAKKEQAKVVISLQEHNHKYGFSRGIKGRKGKTPLTAEELKIKTQLWQIVKSLNQGKIINSGLPEPNLLKRNNK